MQLALEITMPRKTLRPTFARFAFSLFALCSPAGCRHSPEPVSRNPLFDAQVVACFHAAAEQSDAGAQYLPGLFYTQESIADDFRSKEKEAEKWYRLAAAQNHAVASFALGILIFSSRDETREAEAEAWCGKALENGLPMEQSLIDEYQRVGTPEALEKAEAWRQKRVERCRAAAQKGDVKAQWELAGCIMRGEGTPRDPALAAAAFLKAANAAAHESHFPTL